MTFNSNGFYIFFWDVLDVSHFTFCMLLVFFIFVLVKTYLNTSTASSDDWNLWPRSLFLIFGKVTKSLDCMKDGPTMWRFVAFKIQLSCKLCAKKEWMLFVHMWFVIVVNTVTVQCYPQHQYQLYSLHIFISVGW